MVFRAASFQSDVVVFVEQYTNAVLTAEVMYVQSGIKYGRIIVNDGRRR
jgi:hypothetical protein